MVVKIGMGTCLALAAAAGLGGCAETDSWLLDPSVVGRWEHTPTTVPILSRINSIEGPADDWVETSDPTPADLLPEATEYRLGPGDRVTVTVFDIPEEGRPFQHDRTIDSRGYIDLPQIGAVNLGGQTIHGGEEAVKAAMKVLVTNPLAGIELVSPHQNRVSIFGSVQSPQQYLVPTADYKLLDALTAAGGWSEAADWIYVIRQVPLSEASMARSKPVQPGDAKGTGPKPSGPQLNDLIEDLTKPQDKPATPNPPGPGSEPKPGGSPGVMQPTQPPATKPPIDLIDPAAVETEVQAMADDVWAWCEKAQSFGRTVTVKIKYADFQQATRSRTFNAAITTQDALRTAAVHLLRTVYPLSKGIRLVGVTLSSFEDRDEVTSEQLTLALT